MLHFSVVPVSIKLIRLLKSDKRTGKFSLTYISGRDQDDAFRFFESFGLEKDPIDTFLGRRAVRHTLIQTVPIQVSH